MASRHVDAIVVYRGGLSLMIPERGDAYYVRADDGAIGRRRGDTVFWVVVVEDDFETIGTESAGDDVLALDSAAHEIAATIASLRGEG